jgi:hypothetical protein
MPFVRVRLMTWEPKYESAGFSGTVNAPGYRFAFEQTEMPHDEMVKRALAQLMIVLVPSSGLDETVSCLRDIFEFHHRSALGAIPATIERVDRKGLIVGQSDREPLVIGDE